MVKQKRSFEVILLISLLLGSCQPVPEREPVTQPWEEQPAAGVPTETLEPTAIPSPTPIPQMVLEEPANQDAQPTPFVISEQTTNNLYSLPNEDQYHLYGVYGFPPDRNPLTGLRVENPAILNRRPVLTKISNFPATGRPHAGLSFADVVFEYYVGEYMNRFVGLYYGQDTPRAWPLRSGRLVDPQLTTMFQGILVYGNADEARTDAIQGILGDHSLAFKESPCPPICGEETHDATGVYVITDEVTKYINRIGVEDNKPDLNGWLFDDQAPFGFPQVNTIGVQYIKWDRGEWRYDPDSGKYVRWIESWDYDDYPLIPLIDSVNNEPITFSNVVIIFAEYVELAPTAHDIKVWTNTWGERAIFFRDGYMIDGGWYVPDKERPMMFLNNDGTPYRLKPGNTWIVIAGLASEFKQTDAGTYYLYFDLP